MISPDGTRIAYSDDDGMSMSSTSHREVRDVVEATEADWLDDDTLIVSS